jgi:hypothetical protein
LKDASETIATTSYSTAPDQAMVTAARSALHRSIPGDAASRAVL